MKTAHPIHRAVYKPKDSRSSKKRLWVALAIVLALAAAGFGLWKYHIHRQDVSRRASDQHKKANIDPATGDQVRQETTEGQTITVPGNVPSSSIKNYQLVTENEQFKIRKDVDGNTYVITLYAIINNPDQYSAYKDQLKEYKQKALDYLKASGVDITQYKVLYEPDEATNL